MDAHSRHDAAFAAATNRRNNTLVWVLSLLLVLMIVVLLVVAWLYFSPILFHAPSTIPAPTPAVQHRHW